MAITITSITDFQKIGNDVGYPRDGDYELGNDIDASGTSTWNPTADPRCPYRGFSPIESFIGTFDGAGYKVSDLFICGGFALALFTNPTGATISNVTLEDPIIKAIIHDYSDPFYGITSSNQGVAGCLIASFSSTNTVIDNCHIVNGTITDNNPPDYYGGEWLSEGGLLIASAVEGGFITNCTTSGGSTCGFISVFGGICGSSDTTITNCFAEITKASGECSAVGGIVASAGGGSITSCRSKIVPTIQSYSVGGIAATALHCQISKCYNVDNISSANTSGGIVAYLSSSSDVTITDCYNWGDIESASGDAGGIVGHIDLVASGSIYVTNCYSTGTISGLASSGGLIGRVDNPSVVEVTSSYWDTEASGNLTSAGGGTPKTTAEMKQQTMFVDWDFETPIWYIDEGKTYPTFFAPPTATPLTGDAPLTVSFAPGSIKAPAWQFGDGGSSRAKSPKHLYRLPGIYTWRCEG